MSLNLPDLDNFPIIRFVPCILLNWCFKKLTLVVSLLDVQGKHLAENGLIKPYPNSRYCTDAIIIADISVKMKINVCSFQ
jgi:hypothetical protein